jgi:penicillin-insensitive murein DD-endopeptidase
VTSPSRSVRRSLVALGVVAAIATIVFGGNSLAIALESSAPSVSVGRKAAGRLEHGKRLPTSGPNFRAYSRLGALLGRNSVHGDVRATIVDAYGELERTQPGVTFVYGETGWPSGGRIRPHRTHQNGLSADFMVPVRDAAGAPRTLGTTPWRRFGYATEFDADGRAGGLRIDLDAVAAHLLALEHAAAKHGLAIELVIFAPELRDRLARTKQGRDVVRRLPFMQGRAWVRHDEHYHVDFRRLAPGSRERRS